MVENPEIDFTISIQNGNITPKPILDDISIVIPTLGRPILEQSLYWILMGSNWPGCLIIVEQGSNPAVGNWLQWISNMGISVKHILSTQRGRSAGINRGLEQADTPYVAITDDDCFVEKDWLVNIVSKLRQNPGMVVTGRVESAGESMIVVVTSTVPSIQHRPKLKFDSMSGGNMGTSLAVFRKVGLFEEDPVMQTAEDAEWSYRALQKGVSIIYEPTAVVNHFGWRKAEKRVDQYRGYAMSHGGFYGKYLRKGDLFILVRAVLHFVRALRRWINGNLRGDLESAVLGKAYFLYMLPGILSGIRSNASPGDLT